MTDARSSPRRWLAPEWLWLLGAVTISGVLVARNLGSPLSAFDGGISASAATFTLKGLVPYRDYWLLYGPLSGAVLAIPSALFGPSVELVRVAGLLCISAQAAVCYRIARVWSTPAPSVGLAISAVIMLPAILSLDFSAWPLAMTLALGAIYLSIGTRARGVWVGIAIGLAFLSRPDVGAYALVAALLVRDRWMVVLGFGSIAVPAALVALLTVPIEALIEQLLWFPIVGQRLFRSISGPEGTVGVPAATLFSISLLYLPRLAIGLAIIRLFRLLHQRAPRDRYQGLMGLIVFATLCQFQTLTRADLEHFAQAATPAILLLAIWFPGSSWRKLPRFAALSTVIAACLVVGIVGGRIHPPVVEYDAALLQASRAVRSATTVDTPIFVGLMRHLYTHSNPLLIYYLADRPPGVRDTMFNPGMTNTAKVQGRMILDLQAHKVRYLVLDRALAGYTDPGTEPQPGSGLLDEYLGSHYRPICDLGPLLIMGRIDLDTSSLVCPP